MGTLELDAATEDSDLYLTLGLKELRKEVSSSPRVLPLLSSILEKAVQENEKLLEKAEAKDVITIFHGLRAPTVSIQQYVERIFKYAACSPSCFVVAQIYMDKFLQQTNLCLTSLNVHRFLITSVMVAAKFIDDSFFSNAYYAKVGGVSTAELNRLEVKFLFGIDFRLQVNINTFRKYCSRMAKEGEEEVKIERPIQSCRIKESWSNKEDATTCAPTIAR